jgi:hypothetical protein
VLAVDVLAVDVLTVDVLAVDVLTVDVPAGSEDGEEDGLSALVLDVLAVVGLLEIVDAAAWEEEEEEEEDEMAGKLGIVVTGELEPESWKVPFPVWQSQVATVADSQQNPLFPQLITPASERELNIPPTMS